MFKTTFLVNFDIIIILFTVFDATTQQRRFLKNTLKTKPNIFDRNNLKIHAITNNLMLALKLDKHVSESKQFRMLQTKHSYFNSLSKWNCKIYDVLKNISDVNYDNDFKKNISDLLPEIVKETFNIITNDVIKFVNKTNTSEFTNDFIINNTEDSQERFIEMFLRLNQNTWKSEKKTNNENDPYDKRNIKEKEKSQEKVEDTLFNNMDKIIEHNIDLEIINQKTGSSLTKFLLSDKKKRKLKTWHSKIKENKTRRIYKGRKTKIKKYPFVASLHFMDEFLCVGSIISTDMVLTAASCLQTTYNNKLYQYNPRSIFVRVGSKHTKRSGKLIPIIQVILHPKYDTGTLRHNLAVVKMLKNLKHLRKRKVMKIKYNRGAGVLPKSMKEITILGWGAKDAIDRIFPFQGLTMAHLDIYDIKKCQEIYSRNYVTETNFCAGFTSKGGGACVGDVGGPAVFADELVGVVSFGPSVCGMVDAPTVFTDVSYYAQWLDGVIHKKSVKKKTNTKTTNLNLHQSPTIVSLPVYNTESHTHSLSDTVPETVTHAMDDHKPDKPSTQRTDTNDSKEIEFLKKLMAELVIDNKAVVEYLLNKGLYNNESESITDNISQNKSKLFHDSKRYVIKRAHTNLLENSNKKSKWTTNDFLHLKHPRSSSVTKPTEHPPDYVGESTKLAKFVESSELLDNMFSKELGQELLISDNKRPYSVEIQIDDSAFIAEQSKKHIVKATNKQGIVVDSYEKQTKRGTRNPMKINNNEKTTSGRQSDDDTFKIISSESMNYIGSSSVDVHHKSNSEPSNEKLGKFDINIMSSTSDSQTIGTTENLLKSADCGNPTKLPTTTTRARSKAPVTSLDDSIETNNKHFFNI